MIHNRVIETIEENAKIRSEGGFIAIPWLSMPKLSAAIPGVQRGRYFITTANSKIGKSQLTDFLFMYEPMSWYKINPNANIKPKIFYFTLEMSKEDKILAAMSHYIYKNTKKIYTPEQLLSLYNGKYLKVNDINIVKENISDIEFLEKHVTFIDDIRHPTGIFMYMKEYAKDHGHIVYKNVPWRDKETNEIVEKSVPDYYVPTDPNELVIIIIDHVSLFTPENNGTLHEAISKFSSEYALILRDKYKYCVVAVQQQAAASEAQQFTQSGQNIVQKLRPSTDGLGDNKLTQRDACVMIGLFAPHRYNIQEYAGYDIRLLNDNYRELSIILNRRGSGNILDSLFFNGAVNVFRELPNSSEPDIQGVYEYVRQLRS